MAKNLSEIKDTYSVPLFPARGVYSRVYARTEDCVEFNGAVEESQSLGMMRTGQRLDLVVSCRPFDNKGV